MGPYPHDAPPRDHQRRQPDGHRRLRVRRVRHRPSPRSSCRLFEHHGLRGGRQAPLEGRHALSPGRRQLRGQRRAGSASRARFAEQHGPCACAMAFRVVDAEPCLSSARSSLGAKPVETKVGPMELNIPADRGHRRLAHLFRRSLRRRGARPMAGKAFAGLGKPDPRPEGVGLSTISTTSPTTSIAATWTKWFGLLPVACSASVKSASSTSRAGV